MDWHDVTTDTDPPGLRVLYNSATDRRVFEDRRTGRSYTTLDQWRASLEKPTTRGKK